MEWYAAGGLMIGLILVAIFSGMPVAFAFLAANLIGAMLFMRGTIGVEQVVDNATDLVTSFNLAAVPLFVLLGALFFRAGIARRVFDTLDACVGRLPGRLSFLTIGVSTLFSSLTGSTMANTAMLGSLMVPEMIRRGYKPHMALGPVLGSGGLAMIIPPSTMSVLLGSVADLNIGALLVAGLLPGLVLAGLYAVNVLIQVKLDPAAAPSYEVSPRTVAERLRLVAINVFPVGLVIFCVVGLILLGVATPTESAAFGVLGVIMVSLALGSLSVRSFCESLVDTARITAMAFLIVMGSSIFSQILAVTGAGAGIAGAVTHLDLGTTATVLLMFAVILVLGTLMDNLSIILITVPIFFPIVKALGIDPIWFAMIMLMGLQMSSTTPPFGMLLFVMMGVAPPGTKFADVVKAALPFLACDLVLVALLFAFPALATYLAGFV